MNHLTFTAWRRQKGLTQAQAAAYLGKSRWTIIDVESGRRPNLPKWAVEAITAHAAQDIAAWRRNGTSSFSRGPL